MKKIILTIDYELFFGKETGTVKDCMIEPTEKLSSILEKNNSRMTVFWDILHYYRLLEIEKLHSELKTDRLIIEKQILNLTQKGHDVQLHLHPHWLDAKYETGKWNFNYDRFKLHNLSSLNIADDINTITGCVAITKNLMETLIRKELKSYKVTTFRAGGYLIEPFEKLRKTFLNHGINVDSSVCSGLFNDNKISPYDFRDYPSDKKYNFEYTPKIKSDSGSFIEIPITTFKLSGIRNTSYRLLKKIKYSSIEKERMGGGVSELNRAKKNSNVKNIFSSIFKPQLVQFTTDSNFAEKFNYLLKKAPDYLTMILHPKLLNSHTLKLLDKCVSDDQVRFISIQDFLT